MISLQQQKASNFLSPWDNREDHSPLSDSLSCALDRSMKMWQPTKGHAMAPGPPGDLSDERLGNALHLTWTEWTKPTTDPTSNSSATPMRGYDETSVSSGSGSGSRGVSRTPSPFSLPPSSSTSSITHLPYPGNNIIQSKTSTTTTSTGGTDKFLIDTSPDIPSPTPPRQGGQNELYSRKVFVGGLPPDIDQDEIKEHFVRFGPLTVDWPHKAQSKAYFPPKGYAFLLFRDEIAVRRLVKTCVAEDGKLFMFVSSVTQTHKKVQIRPWKLPESDYIMDHTQPIDARKTIFIGGVPRPLKAAELADIFNSRYGNVCYAGIDCDPELKYPKGAGRVTFSSRVSFMSAVSCRFLQVTYGDIDKKVEVKPYVLDDQICDECHGLHCGGRYAPYFCGNIHCLRYYCEHCWGSIHSAPGTQNHRCFIKENGDRPRAINFFPSHPRVSLP